MPEKLRYPFPEPLSTEWMRQKAAAMLHDLRTLLRDMNPKDSARLINELKKLSEGDLGSEFKNKNK